MRAHGQIDSRVAGSQGPGSLLPVIGSPMTADQPRRLPEQPVHLTLITV